MSQTNPIRSRLPTARIAAAVMLTLLALFAIASETVVNETDQRTNIAVEATITTETGKDASVVTFTVRVANEGPGFAKGVLLETIADSSVLAKLGERHLRSRKGTRCHNEILACEIGDLAADDVVTIQIIAKVTASEATTIGLEFRIASQSIDSIPFDNRYYSSVFVPAR